MENNNNIIGTSADTNWWLGNANSVLYTAPQVISDACSSCGSFANLRRVKKQFIHFKHDLTVDQVKLIQKMLKGKSFLEPVVLGHESYVHFEEFIVCQNCIESDNKEDTNTD